MNTSCFNNPAAQSRLKIFARLFLMAVAIFCPGCGTILQHSGGGCMSPKGIDGIYRGTRMDGSCIIFPFVAPFLPNNGNKYEASDYALLPVLFVAGVVDLPFSLGADTVMLPFDLSEMAAQNKDKEDMKE